MKRVVCSRDPVTNPSDRAEALIDSLDDVLTELRRLCTRYRKFYDSYKHEDSEMIKLSECMGDLPDTLQDQLIHHKNDVSRKNTINYPRK